MNYENLKATIAANIYQNGRGEVTAEMVKTAMNEVVDTLIAGGYLYKGVAHPGDAAETPDANVFYLATEVGTYTNKGGLQVTDGEVAVLKYNGSWSKEVTGAATAAQVSELNRELGGMFGDSNYDFSIADEQGNAILELNDGHIKTKKFDSRDLFEPKDMKNPTLCDFAIADEQGNILVELLNGHIRTKKFNSATFKKYGSFSIIGDSYSTFKGFTNPASNAQWYPTNDESTQGYNTGNDVVDVTEMWWFQFANEYGCILMENNSYSGSTICYDGYQEGHDSGAAATSFCKRVEDMTEKTDLFFIFGGTNDSWAGSAIGNYKYSGWTEEDKSYFRPALAYLIDYIQKHHIGSKIVFILNTGLSSQINESITTICEHYDVDVVALSNIDKISGHPSVLGMGQIKEQIINVL